MGRSLQRQRVTQKQPTFVECGCLNNGNRLGSHMFCRFHRHYSIVKHCKTKKSRLILNFAHCDSLVCTVTRTWEKSHSPLFSLAAACSHSRLQVYQGTFRTSGSVVTGHHCCQEEASSDMLQRLHSN